MSNLALCRWCGKQGHLLESCPERKPVRQSTKVKKPWVKPELTRWVKANEVLTDNANKVLTGKEKRREYMKQLMRRKRAKVCLTV